MSSEIEETRARISARIASIEEKITELARTVDLDEFEERGIQTQSGPLGFYDEIWHSTLELADQMRYEESINSFIEIYRKVIQEKADKNDLPEKVDRSYVDSKMKESEESILNAANEKLDSEFESVQDQIDQIRNNTEAIKQHFEQNSMAIRRELASIKKQFEFNESEKEKEKTYAIHSPPPLRSVAKTKSRAELSPIVLGNAVKNRPVSIHTPYKQHTPFKPELPGLFVSSSNIN